MSVSCLVRCCIPQCSSTNISKKMYKFPTHNLLLTKWKAILINKYSNIKLGCDSQGKCQRYICSLHFEEKYIDMDGKRVPWAYPTLFSDTEILSRKPSDHYTIEKTYNQPGGVGSVASSNSIMENAVEIPGPSQGGVDSVASSNSVMKNFVEIPGPSQGGVDSVASSNSVMKNFVEIPGPSQGANLDHSSSKTLSTTESSVAADNSNSKGRRNKIIKSIKALTPKCNRIYRKCIGIIKAKRRLAMTYKERLQKAEKLSETKSFQAMVNKLPQHTKTFISMQVNAFDKEKRLRRFTNEEKLLALTLLKQSPKGYKLLQKLFVLPSRRTLSTFTQDFKMNPGLNSNVLYQLKQTVCSWDNKKKACAIVFDEMSLSPHLSFVEAQNCLSGFVNFGNGSQKRFCDHALVFMVRGIVSSWKQMIAFYFCEGTTPALTLKNILRDVVDEISKTGLVPMALICDQGSTFQTTLKSFQMDTRREQLKNDEPEGHKININGHHLYIIYDPPHLLKGIRNNFLNKDLSFCGKTATWKDIVEAYKADCRLGNIKLCPKVTDEHIYPSSSQRMKVKLCTQTLSERMSAMLYYTSGYKTHFDGTQVSGTMRNTAEAVHFFDKLFDSVNGSRSGGVDKGKMRGPVKDDRGSNKHVSFWVEAIGILENCFFFESSPDGHITKKWVPTIANWIITLKSFIGIWNDLKDIEVKYFYTRHLNQDPLENFFGRVRALNHRFNHPDAYSFQCSFKSLLITNTLGPHSPHSNCEDDMGGLLFALKKNIDSAECDPVTDSSGSVAACDVPSAEAASPARQPALDAAAAAAAQTGPASPSGRDGTTLFRQVRMEKTNTQAAAFTAGYVSRKLIARFKCPSCKKSFLTSDISDLHTWITYRERKLNTQNRHLKYPNSQFVMLFKLLVDIINKYVDNYPHRPNILNNIKVEFLEKYNVEWLGCPLHHNDVLNLFITLVCRLQIHNFCMVINRILKGSYSEKSINPFFTMQRLALDKRKRLFGLRKSKQNV